MEGHDVEAIIDQNKKELTDKIRNLVSHLVSQEMIHKMPIEIKWVLNCHGFHSKKKIFF